MPADRVDLTLLRHGESTYNAEGLYQGTLDLPVLTPKGRAQAKAAARLLGERFDALWVSPLARAEETAQTLAQALQLPKPQTVAALREVHLPEWEGRAFADVRKEDPARYLHWKFAPEAFRMTTPVTETHVPVEDVLTRASEIIGQALALPMGSRTLAVTHGGMIRALLVVALGMNPNFLHSAILDNCSVTRLSLSREGAHRLQAFNQTSRPPALASGGKPLILFAPSSRVFQLSARFPGAALLDLRQQVFDPRLTRAPGLIVHGTPKLIEEALQALLGMSGQGPLRLSLAADTVHVAVQKTDSNPAALWLMNQPVQDTRPTDVAPPSIQEVF